MPLRDADARRLEQLLGTLTPPAVVTAPYRQQVVQASFDARLKVLARRQRRKAIGSCALVFSLLLLPGFCAALFGRSFGIATTRFPWPAASTVSADPLRHATVDAFEQSLIQAHVQSRAQFGRAARPSADHD